MTVELQSSVTINAIFFHLIKKKINKLQIKLVRKFDLVNFKIKVIFDKSLFISINVKLYICCNTLYICMFIYNYYIQLFAHVCNFFQIIKMTIYHDCAIKEKD